MRERENGRTQGVRSSLSPRVSPSRAPIFSCAHYFQAPVTQASKLHSDVVFASLLYRLICTVSWALYTVFCSKITWKLTKMTKVDGKSQNVSEGTFWFFHLSISLKIGESTCYIWELKGDVKRDDSQQRFLAQHSVTMLEQCCNHLKQCRNNVATLCCTKNRRSESSRVTSP